MNRITALLGLVALALLAAVPAASASSIAYVAADGNVRLVSPDGSRDVPITANATPDASYRSLSQLDDGRIVAVGQSNGTSSFAFFFGRDGQLLDAWNLPSSGVGGFAPYSGAYVSPQGGMIAYDYRHFDCSTNPCQGNQRVGFVSGPGQTSPCLVNCYVGYVAPRWIPDSPYAAMVGQSFNAVYAQQQGSAFPVGWFQYGSGISIFGLDIRAGKIAVSAGVGDTEYLVLERMTGPPPSLPQSQCSVNMPDDARPRLSPDGTMIAWSAPEGVMVSPTPTQSGGTETLCQLSPRLVAAGGTEPEWGIADVPTAPAPLPAPAPAPAPGGGSGKGGTAGANLTAVMAPKLAKALVKGIAAGFRCSGPCRVKATATVSKATARAHGLGRAKTKIGSGKASLKAAGAGKIRIAFTAKAKRKLADAARVPVEVTLRINDATGGQRKLTKRVTLKR